MKRDGWLVLTRKPEAEQDTIRIGEATVIIHRVRGQEVKVCVQAPEGIKILRGELAGTPDIDASENRA